MELNTLFAALREHIEIDGSFSLEQAQALVEVMTLAAYVDHVATDREFRGMDSAIASLGLMEGLDQAAVSAIWNSAFSKAQGAVGDPPAMDALVNANSVALGDEQTRELAYALALGVSISENAKDIYERAFLRKLVMLFNLNDERIDALNAFVESRAK